MTIPWRADLGPYVLGAVFPAAGPPSHRRRRIGGEPSVATMVATGLAGLTATPGVVLMVVASHAFKDEMIMVPTPVVVLGFAGIVAGLVLVSVAFGVAAQLGLRYDGAGLVGVVYGSCVAGVGGCLLTIHGGSGTAGQLAEGMLVAGLTTVGLLMSNAARADFKRSDSVVPSL